MEWPPQNNNESEASEEKNEFGFTKTEWDALDEYDREGYEMCLAIEQAQPEKVEVEKVPYTEAMAEELESMINGFYEKFPIEELLEIKTSVEADKSEMRESARIVRDEIYEFIKRMSEETLISSEEVSDAMESHKRIELIVGIRKDGVCYHE